MTSQIESAHSSTTTTPASTKESLREELRAKLAEGEVLRTRLKILEATEKTTAFTRDAALAVGTGVATVVSGPAGGAAFRAGVGSLSHVAEHGVGGVIDAPNTQSLATQLKGDVIDGTLSYVGGTVALKAASAAASTLGKQALSTTTSKLLTAEAAALSNATVQNGYTVGDKVLSGEKLTSQDAKAIAANYLAAGLSAGISSKVPVTPRLSTANAAEAVAGAGIAAGQQYITEGRVSPDGVLVAGLQNVASSAAVAKRANLELPSMKHAATSHQEPDRTRAITVHGIPHDEVSTAVHNHLQTWRDGAQELSPLQRWTFEEAEKHGLLIEVVKKKGTASPGKVEVSLEESYDAPEIAVQNARRGMYNALSERALGKAPDLSSPAAVYLHRLCEELAVSNPQLERARFEMLKRHGVTLSEMGLSTFNQRTSGDLRNMVNELRRFGHPEQAAFYKECLNRAGIDVDLEGANRGVKIPVYGLADASVIDPLRQSLADWSSQVTDATPLTKWVMESAGKHRVEVIVIKRGSHAYDGTRVGVALDDIRPSHGAAEIARHELWHAVSMREFFEKVDPKRSDRKEPASLYLDELVAHLAAGRNLQDAHTHVMHNYGPSFDKMKWPETYAKLNGDLNLILKQVSEKVSPEHSEFYRRALVMAGVEVKNPS
jgi:hypothetical protein